MLHDMLSDVKQHGAGQSGKQFVSFPNSSWQTAGTLKFEKSEPTNWFWYTRRFSSAVRDAIAGKVPLKRLPNKKSTSRAVNPTIVDGSVPERSLLLNCSDVSLLSCPILLLSVPLILFD